MLVCKEEMTGVCIILYKNLYDSIILVLGDVKAIELFRDNPPEYRYYIHFVDYNRRMETWLKEDQMDLTRVYYPQRKKKDAGQLSPDDDGNRKKRMSSRVGSSNIEYVPYNEAKIPEDSETPAARRGFLFYFNSFFIIIFQLEDEEKKMRQSVEI